MGIASRVARSALLAVCSVAAMTAPIAAPAAYAGTRIKDITDFKGVRENQLVGYGLVVGLAGTGDSLRNSAFTRQSLEAMLERLGVAAAGAHPNTRNDAAVIVTSNQPPRSVWAPLSPSRSHR